VLRKQKTSHQADEWLPALGRAGSVGAYDRVMSRLSLDAVYGLMADQIHCEPGSRLLDLGCGTGALGAVLASSLSDVTITGIDRDPRMLVRAANRWARGEASGVMGLAHGLPFADDAFDAVTATLFLHHLTSAQKLQALVEAKRVLRAGGRLYIADWTKPRPGLSSLGFVLVRLLDGYDRTADHAAGRIGEIIQTAGFNAVEEPRPPLHTWLGALGFYRAAKVQ
jgi:ubiquinone/menaquinone biosynthesis C-methylase UbiE